MHNTTVGGRSSCPNFKWVWKDSELELLIHVVSNKNGREFDKNLEVMMGATRAQFLK
jgi:hypothetical protein